VNWVWSNADFILDKTLVHLQLSSIAIVASLVLALPIGWAANRVAPLRGVVLTVAGLFYSVPSFALLVVLPTIVGYGLRSDTNLVVALTLYGLALMVRSVADGLASVEPDVRQSATAVGYSSWQRFWRVEVPLAGPVLLAGLRVVAVSTISLATVGGLIGINGLGLLFTDGLQRYILEEIAAGIVMTIVLALLVDAALVLLGRALMPWTRGPSRAERRQGALVGAAA